MPDKSLTKAVKTPGGSLTPGQTYDLTLRHGASERIVKKAKLTVFEQSPVSVDPRLGPDAEAALQKAGINLPETRYEIEGDVVNTDTSGAEPREYLEHLTLGILPENVLKATKVASS